MKSSRSILWITTAAVAMLAWSALVARADYVEVRRPATVKAAPHRDALVLRRVSRGDLLALAASIQDNGYYAVTLPEGGGTGWVYRTLVRRHPGNIEGGSTAHSGRLEVHVINVGQADAILVRCPDGEHELLIDAAGSRSATTRGLFKAYMRAHQATSNEIEVVVATHPHSDHIGDMAWVLGTYSVGLYVDNGNEYDTATYRRVDDAWMSGHAGYWGADEEVAPDVDFCPRADVSAVVLRPAGFGESSDPNDNSVVVRVDYGEDSFLFVGDAEAEEEGLLLQDAQTRSRLDCDFLKVGHHASETSSTDAFLQVVTPAIAAVSCGSPGVGMNSTHKHPRFSTVNRLLGVVGLRSGGAASLQAYDTEGGQWRTVSVNQALYVTSADGDIVLESDGHGIRKR
ncbi:MAG: MBL fold metallo-hydrolase [bacterium]|nr:MBL fold metallo-hydrolase [bacterium]